MEPVPPPRLARRPRDRHGRIVPWFVGYVDGQPDHRVIREGGILDAVRFRICFQCGVPLGAHSSFVIGPMCAVNRISAEPPAHRDCAEYAVQACPFLTHPHMRRRENGLPEDVREPDGIMHRRNPGVSLIWTTRTWAKQPGKWLFTFDDPTEVTWWAEGRPATNDEAHTGLVTGLQQLQQEADQDPRPRQAHAHLQRQYERALTHLRATA